MLERRWPLDQIWHEATSLRRGDARKHRKERSHRDESRRFARLRDAKDGKTQTERDADTCPRCTRYRPPSPSPPPRAREGEASLIHHAKRVNSRGDAGGSAGSDLFCGADAVGRRQATPFQRFAPDPETRGGGVARDSDDTTGGRRRTRATSRAPGFRCIPLWKCDLARLLKIMLMLCRIPPPSSASTISTMWPTPYPVLFLSLILWPLDNSS